MQDKCKVANSIISKIFKHKWTRRALAISIVLCSITATIIAMYEYVIK
jgi:hypothetical protein